MARSKIGLDIGSTAVRVAEVIPGDTPVLLRAAQVPLPAGAVETGEIRDQATVSEALRELWSKSGVKGKQVNLGVGNQRVVVREVALPWLPEKELRASLGFQVQEFIPMTVDEAVLDFDPLGEMEQGGRKMTRILLVAAHEAMVNALVEAVTAAKLDPVSIDLTPFAVVRSVGTSEVPLGVEHEGDEAILDVGAQVTTICVHDHGVTRFVRILPSGGRDVTLAIARGLGVDEQVAEQLKRGQPIEPPEVDSTSEGEPTTEAARQVRVAPEASPVPPPPGQQPASREQRTAPEDASGGEDRPPTPAMPRAEDVRRVAMSRASSFVDEVRSSLEFYAAQVPGARIGRVLVVGGGSKLDGFLEIMQERIPVPVERGRVFEHVKSELDLSPEALEEAEPVLAAAVGLAISARRRP